MKINTRKTLFVCEIDSPALNGKPFFCRGQHYLPLPPAVRPNDHISAYERIGSFNEKEAEIKDGFIYYKAGRLRRKILREENGTYVLRERAQIKNEQEEWEDYWYDDWDRRR